MQKNNFFIRLAQYSGFAGLLGLSSLIKFSWIVGSHISFFSGINIVAPLSGAFGGIFGGIAAFVLRTAVNLCFFGVLSVKCLMIGIPNFFASLYWSSSHWLIRVGLPLICMVLFWIHPVGFSAGVYALYWLIPIMVHYLSRKHIFFEALGSTFVAHAVGSIIWLYTIPMTAGTWLALIPVVAVERLLFATGMVLVHYGITMAIRSMSTIQLYGELNNAITYDNRLK